MAEQYSLLDGTIEKAPRVVYFDLETLRSAGDVGGWGNIHKMGMAVGVLYDSIEKDFFLFEENEVMGLIQHLQRADLVVGFNHIRFDYRVLSGYSKLNFSILPSFDILVDLEARLGHRLKLDSIAKSTLGESKSADGLVSLQWVKEGRLDLVRDYCRQDVAVTRDVFLYGANNGKLLFDSFGNEKEVSVDWNVDSLVQRAKSLKGESNPSSGLF